MKKILITILICAVLISLAPVPKYTRAATPIKDKIEEIKDKIENFTFDFNVFKGRILKGLDRLINGLNILTERINSNPRVDPATKEIVLAELNKIEEGLINYKVQIEQAENLDELQAINQEIIKYLIDNKEVIKENLIQVIVSIGEQARETAEELQKKINTILNTMKLICPEEAAAIKALQNQLDELNSLIASLASALQTKDPVLIKKVTQDIAVLGQKIIKNLQQVGVNCF